MLDRLPDQRVVEGATPEREKLIAECSGHKFESFVHMDAAGKRAKRVKLCANPGATDAEWVATLKSAIAQIDAQPFPAAAKAQLETELRAEIAKFDGSAKSAGGLAKTAPSTAATATAGGGLVLDPKAVRGFDMPNDRFETSTLPSLDRPAPVAVSAVPAGGASVGTAAAAATLPPVQPMRVRVTCLAPGERGSGITCDYLRDNTVLVIRALGGMEKGARLRFLRRGEERGEVLLAGMANGDSTKVRIPLEVCRGVSSTKVELQLLPTDSRGRVAGTIGTYGVRC